MKFPNYKLQNTPLSLPVYCSISALILLHSPPFIGAKQSLQLMQYVLV